MLIAFSPFFHLPLMCDCCSTKPIWLRCVWVQCCHFYLCPIRIGAVWPCFGWEQGESLPNDASGENTLWETLRCSFQTPKTYGPLKVPAWFWVDSVTLIHYASAFGAGFLMDQRPLEHLNSRAEKSPTRTVTSGAAACIAIQASQRC